MYLSFSDRKGGKAAQAWPSSTPFKISPVIISLGIVSMFTDISSESVAAVLPLYITGVLGLSMVAYGFLDGIHQGISAIVRIGAGWTADRGDRHKAIAVLGYGLSTFARVWLLFATGFGAITAVIGLDRIGKGIRTAPRDAMITEAAQPEHLARSFGVHRMLDTVGATIGPLLAFIVLLLIPNGYHTVFVVSLACGVLGLAVLGLLVPGRRQRVLEKQAAIADTASQAVSRAPFAWRELNNPQMRRLLLLAGILGLVTIGDGFIYLVLQSKASFAATWFPLLYVGTNLAYLVLAVPLGRLADRWGRLRVFIAGHGALLAAYLCAVLPATGAAFTIGALLLLGVFYAATDGVLAALAGQFSPEASKASGIAAAQTVVAASRFFASVGFGTLWFMLGREHAMVVAAVALAAALVAAVILVRRLLPGAKSGDSALDAV
ncbi:MULTISPECIES: MFS transporter [Arthrobacter]|uniref:MFS transporter n=1 Tax=Arthrobacter psychrochitiniphilus TaxID=291045 RepID=A0A2V3DMS4_9MICC|nr:MULTISPECIES: MFS transporter [Arthrobacter]NYG18006.1 MFS family permease [Arthrobacter psychrochitiniphilus]PXA64263.1 MFS transporter [Arthrobacter psychrochitiniphilus]